MEAVLLPQSIHFRSNHFFRKNFMKNPKLIQHLCLVAFVTLLAGCTDPEVKAVKSSRLMENMPTFSMILDDRADCGSIKWATPTDDNGRKYVTATCTLNRTMASEAKEQAIGIADRALSERAQFIKTAYAGEIRQAEERVSYMDKQAAGRDPSTISPYEIKQYQEISERLNARKQEADAYLAEVDARKDREMQAFKAMLDSGEPLAAEYYFRVRGGQGELTAMRLLVGGQKRNVSAGEEMFSMMRLGKRDLESERTWWARRLATLVSMKSIDNCSYTRGCV